MRRSISHSWVSLGLDAWALGMEASTVVGLRTMKLAMGGAASEAEAKLMVEEKVAAAMHVQLALLTGKYGTDPIKAGQSVLQHYARKTRANRLRLSKASG